MREELLRVEHLKKYFKTPGGELHAVDDVSFTIPKGHTLGVVGESGCGKSTLGRTILRLTPHTEGEIHFEGEDILTYSKAQMKVQRQEMQMIFQDPFSSLNPKMTVAQLIAQPLQIHHICAGKDARMKKVYELMDMVGLAQRYVNVFPHELDGGRRQRIGIARALALNPKFIVCDEPVSALDVSIQAQILNLMMDLKDQLGLTYMFITHDLSVVKHISDEIMVMYLGQVVEQAVPEQLFRFPKHPYTQALLAAIPVPDISRSILDMEVLKGEVTSPVDPPPGCRFAPRCKHCTEACHKCDSELKDVGDGHKVRCHLFD